MRRSFGHRSREARSRSPGRFVDALISLSVFPSAITHGAFTLERLVSSCLMKTRPHPMRVLALTVLALTLLTPSEPGQGHITPILVSGSIAPIRNICFP